LNKKETIESICNLVNGRIDGTLHINSETATHMISEYITEYVNHVNKALNHKIICLESRIEHFENLPDDYKYLHSKKIDDMSGEEFGIYYDAIPRANLLAYDCESVEDYLRKHAVIDKSNDMDGSWVPLSIAMIAAHKVEKYELEYKPPSWIKK
jgi:hypothetical protein